jgi:hypothetical protein
MHETDPHEVTLGMSLKRRRVEVSITSHVRNECNPMTMNNLVKRGQLQQIAR